jgi:hypothetical protein
MEEKSKAPYVKTRVSGTLNFAEPRRPGHPPSDAGHYNSLN